MDAETKAMVERIDAKIRRLRQMREDLLEEFGGADSTIPTNHRRPRKRKPTRKDEVIAFLKTHGATKAKDISKETKIPQGSIGWILNDKETFTRNDEGKWSLKEPKEAA